MVLFVLGVVYGPVLRWAVVQHRRERRPVAPLPPMAEFAVIPWPRSAEVARRVEATETERWLAEVRDTWDADLSELKSRLDARVGVIGRELGRAAA